MLGLALRTVLPKHHLSADSRELMKLGMGLIGTIAALVVGLLVASAESSYDAQREVAQERITLVNKYQQCVKEAGDNQQKAAACDSYLKAAEALK